MDTEEGKPAAHSDREVKEGAREERLRAMSGCQSYRTGMGRKKQHGEN